MAVDALRAKQCYACLFHHPPNEAHDRAKCLAVLQEKVKEFQDITARWKLRHQRAKAWWQAHSPR